MYHMIKKTLKKIGIGVFVFSILMILIGFFFRSIVGTNNNQPSRSSLVETKAELNKFYKDPANSKTPQQRLVLSITRYISCGIVGAGCIDKDGEATSLLGRLTTLTGHTLTHPPASGVGYTYMVFERAGIVPKSYAAEGIGFAAIKGFSPLWQVFRNVCYGILVLVMVIVSFMIMFRFKLNAQTAVSIESALPRLVLSLLLITFSYAIAGFMIDMMYVLMGVVITVMCANGTYCDINTAINQHFNNGAGALFDSFFPYDPLAKVPVAGFLIDTIFGKQTVQQFSTVFTLSNSIMNILPGIVQVFILLLAYTSAFISTNMVMSLFNNSHAFSLLDNIAALTASLGQAPGGIQGIIAGLSIMGIISFIAVPIILMVGIMMTIALLFFRIFFMLLSTYLRILLLILLAPVFMLFEAIPGRDAFSFWFKNLFGELLTFPLVTLFFMFGTLIVNNLDPVAGSPVARYDAWQPPYLYGIDQKAFLFVAGMGFLFLIPDLVKMTKELLGVKGLPLNFGIGTFFTGAGVGLGAATGMLGKSFGFAHLFLRQGQMQEFFGKHVGPLTETMFRRRTPSPRSGGNTGGGGSPGGGMPPSMSSGGAPPGGGPSGSPSSGSMPSVSPSPGGVGANASSIPASVSQQPNQQGLRNLSRDELNEIENARRAAIEQWNNENSLTTSWKSGTQSGTPPPAPWKRGKITQEVGEKAAQAKREEILQRP